MNLYSCVAFVVFVICITKMVNNFINHIWNERIVQDDKMKLRISLESEEDEDEKES